MGFFIAKYIARFVIELYNVMHILVINWLVSVWVGICMA